MARQRSSTALERGSVDSFRKIGPLYRQSLAISRSRVQSCFTKIIVKSQNVLKSSATLIAPRSIRIHVVIRLIRPHKPLDACGLNVRRTTVLHCEPALCNAIRFSMSDPYAPTKPQSKEGRKKSELAHKIQNKSLSPHRQSANLRIVPPNAFLEQPPAQFAEDDRDNQDRLPNYFSSSDRRDYGAGKALIGLDCQYFSLLEKAHHRFLILHFDGVFVTETASR